MLNLHNNNTQGAEQSSLIARDNCNFLRVIKLEDVNYMLVFHLWSEDLCAPLYYIASSEKAVICHMCEPNWCSLKMIIL